MLCVTIAAVSAVFISHLHDQALLDARRELRALSLILADQADRALEAVELLQTGILDRLSDAGVETVDAFRREMGARAMHDELRSRAGTLPIIDAITAIDAEGTLVNFSRYWPIPDVNVADRDYFMELQRDPQLTSFLGAPVPNRGSGTWTIYLARKVTSSNGEFLGLILGAVELAYFERLYARVLQTPGSSISLFRQDGTLLARYPRTPSNVGRPLANTGLLEELTAPGATHAEAVVTSLSDGLRRLVTMDRSTRYPVAVAAGVALDSVLAGWRQQAAIIAGAAAMLEIVIAAMGLLLLRQFRAQGMLAEATSATAAADAARHRAEAELALTQERSRAERALTAQDQRFEAALANMSHALCMFDRENRLVVANARLGEMFGLPPGMAVPGVSFAALVERARTDSNLAPKDLEAIRRALARTITRNAVACDVRELADGRALSMIFQPMPGQGWLATIEDITERRQAEARIAHMAHHDALTGLPNRVLFQKRLQQAAARGRRGDLCAVLCLDLDHFKAVNDTLGHPVGDALLRAVTQRLLHQVRKTDTVARLGGDEFAIVQSSVDQPQDAAALALRLIETLSAPYELEGHQVVIGTSIGIAIVPQDGDDPHQILKNADLALYRAKGDGRGRYRLFEPAMDATMQARRALELDLRRALEDGDFELFYQPLMTLNPRAVCGFEALLRWRHAERGLISPAEFMPLAEEIGLIVPLGQWVLRQACNDAVTWPGALRVAVNLSAVQFVNRHLVQEVIDALEDSGLPAHRLELEITETAMVADIEATLSVLHRLRGLGISIAMDDFGTGYSSLSFLRRFPFDKVKIDRIFIEELGQGGDCDAIVAAVTELCQRLGMTTTAEGVETEAQLARLGELFCTEAQGYLFSRPRPAAEVPDVYRRLNQAEANAGAKDPVPEPAPAG